MATEQEILDLKLRLSAEEKDTQPIRRFMRDIERMKQQAEKLANIKLGGNFIDEGTRRAIMGATRSVDTLSRSMLDTARAAKTAGKMSAAAYATLTNDIIANVDKLNRAKSKKEKDNLRVALRRQIQYADAYAAVFNSAAEKREQIETSIRDRIARADDAADRMRIRNKDKTEREILRNSMRARRELWQASRGLYGKAVGFGSSTAMYGAAAAGSAGYAAKSAFTARMRQDTAETNMQIFGGLTREQVSKMRSDWGDADAIKFGLAPERLMESFTEVAKAGIPDRIAKEVTESILKASVGLEMDSTQTTKLAGSAATLFGDMKDLDPKRITSMMSAIAIAARDSRADADEIVAANRRGSSVLGMGMSMEDLSAFTAGGISAGLQSSKTGTFMDYIVSELVGAKFKKGARGQALGAAATKLGLGGKAGMSANVAANPTETLMTILDKMGDMSDQDRAKVAYQIGQREWSGELMQFVQVRAKIRELLDSIKDPKNSNFIDEASEKKLKSLQGRWNSLTATWKLFWGNVGAGLEESFGQIVPWLTNYLARTDKGKIRGAVESFMRGMVKGLGFDSWDKMLESTLGDPTKMEDYSATFFKVAKGFAEGLNTVFTTVKTVFTGLGKMFGVNTADPEAMAKFAAEFLGFAIALRFIAPVVGVLTSIAEVFIKLGKALGAGALSRLAGVPVGGPVALGLILSALADYFTPESAKKKPGETTSQWRERQNEHRRQLYQKQSGEGFNPADVHPMSFTSSADRLGDNLQKFGAKLERASLMGGLTDFSSINRGGGGLQYAVATSGGSAGSGGGGFGSRILSGAGTPDALLKSVPGAALPNFGVGSGGIIKRGGIPSFGGDGAGTTLPKDIPSFSGGGGSAADDVGAGLNGSAFLAARRARFADEIKNDPNLRLHLAAMQMTEGASRGGTIESLMNRMDMQGSTLRKGLGYGADGSINPRSFYGPVRRGELGPAIEKLRRNPKLFQQYDAYTQKALAGSHTIGGYTDQGLPTDPNGSRRTGIPGFKINPKDGNEFTDWVGPGSSWGRGRNGAMNYRRYIEQHINDVPTPADAVKNVPDVPQSAVPMSGGGGGGGPVSININGNSHDPEALANLVQRRIDESMNWRTHDTESEYT